MTGWNGNAYEAEQPYSIPVCSRSHRLRVPPLCGAWLRQRLGWRDRPRRPTPPRTPNGNVVRSSSGAAVSKEAEANWKEATAAFEAADKAGWNAEQLRFGRRDLPRCQQEAGRQVCRGRVHAGPGRRPLRQVGRGAQAVQRRRSRSTPSSAARAWVSASMHFKKGSEAQAFASFEQAVRDDARCTEGYVNLAMMQMARSGASSEDALNNLRRALAIDAQYLPAFNQMALLFLGRAQDNKKMLDLAGVVCRQAQLINANYAPIYNTWGLINVQQGERLRRAPHVREGGAARPQELRSSHELRPDHAQLPRLRGRARRSARRSS